MSADREAQALRTCACSGCGAPHHQTGKVARARWYLETSPSREEVCGTCANKRTTHPIRSEYLTPIEGLRPRLQLAGNVVAGLPITSVPAEDEDLCQCYDPKCPCNARCNRTALYQWGSVDHHDWQFLCRLCCLRLVERGTGPDDLGEGVATDS